MPKTITDIIPPSRRRAMMEANGETPPPPPPTSPHDDVPMPPKRKKGFPYGLALGALGVLVICIALIYAFAGAKVEVNPTVSQVMITGEFSATPSVGDLAFESVSVDTVATQSVPAEGTETVDEPAQGTITVYNAQDKVQELIKNTRFETPDGLIFRIRESVRVPAGSDAAPGTLNVTVYADQGGERYNVGPSTFTLPGLSGSALFDLVYARSTEAMVGGFSGTRPSVAASTRDNQYEAMKPKIEADLRAAISEKVPEDHILIPGSLVLSYTPMPDQSGTSGTVGLQQKGTATALIFPKEALASAIAYKVMGAYQGEPITISDAGTLSLTPSPEGEFAPGAQSIAFSLSGEVELTWIVDPVKIAGSVAGKTREAAKTILSGLPEVETARLTIRPFWVGALPDDPAEIKVKVIGE